MGNNKKPDLIKKDAVRIEFDLVKNAKDSLNHAVEHLTEHGLQPSDIKIAIREVAHVVELFLKERLSRIHPAFIWENVDDYRSYEARTVDLERAIKRLSKLAGITLHEDAWKTIQACKKIRNRIEHYAFSIELKEAKVIIGRMLSFILEFSATHLQMDLEKEFRSDDRWKVLIDIYEFWEAHAEATERKLEIEGIPFGECPSCGAHAFVWDESKCRLCDHKEEEVVCDVCGNTVWESEAEYFNNAEEEGPEIVCKSCLDAEAAEDFFINQAIDEQRESRGAN